MGSRLSLPRFFHSLGQTQSLDIGKPGRFDKATFHRTMVCRAFAVVVDLNVTRRLTLHRGVQVDMAQLVSASFRLAFA